MSIKKLLLLASGVLLFAGCANQTEESAASETESTKSITVGLDETFAPMGFRDDNNELVGFDVDLAKETLGRLGYEVVFQPIDWAMKETELNTGNIDLIWNGYAITPEREEKVLLSEPYLSDSQMIVVRKDSDIKVKADLEGKIVSTQQSSSSIDKIKNDESGIYNKLNGDLVLYPSNSNSFLDLEAKRVDAIVVGESYGRYYIKESNKEDLFTIIEENFGEDHIAVALRKEDTDLKAQIDRTIEEMRADGTYDEIYQNWFFSE